MNDRRLKYEERDKRDGDGRVHRQRTFGTRAQTRARTHTEGKENYLEKRES